MKIKFNLLLGIIIAGCMLSGCESRTVTETVSEETMQEAKETVQKTNETLHDSKGTSTREDSSINDTASEKESAKEINPYENTISAKTKEHAKAFKSLDEQYASWRGAHVNNKFEYAWVTVEPYVSKMNDYVEAYDAVDWALVEASSEFDEKTFDAIADAGYNFVRIPLDTRFFFTDDKYFNVDSTGETWNGDIKYYNVANWEDLDRAIGWCIDRDIHVCIDVHSTPGGFMIGGDEEESRKGLFSTDDSANADIFLEFWSLATKRYQDIDAKALSFNLYNEPPSFMHERQDDYAKLMLSAIDKIRIESPERLIFVDTLDYSTCGFDSVEMFSEVDNLIFSFHYYSDYQWSTDEMLDGNWKEECDRRIAGYNDWAETNGVKWMLQEYGIQSDIHALETQLEYIQYVTECVAGYEVPYCHYGFATGTPFNLYNGESITDPELVALTVK